MRRVRAVGALADNAGPGWKRRAAGRSGWGRDAPGATGEAQDAHRDGLRNLPAGAHVPASVLGFGEAACELVDGQPLRRRVSGASVSSFGERCGGGWRPGRVRVAEFETLLAGSV